MSAIPDHLDGQYPRLEIEGRRSGEEPFVKSARRVSGSSWEQTFASRGESLQGPTAASRVLDPAPMARMVGCPPSGRRQRDARPSAHSGVYAACAVGHDGMHHRRGERFSPRIR